MRQLRAGLVALVLVMSLPGTALAVPQLVSFTPASSDYHWADTMVAGPTVSLSEPVESDTIVTVVSSATSVVTSSVTIAAGQTSAAVPVTCADTGSATLRATLDATERTAAVRCLAVDAPIVQIQPSQARAAVGGEVTVTAAVDRQPGGTTDPKYRLTVTGPNATTQTKDTTGVNTGASFSYVGHSAGVDSVQVCLLDASDACTSYATIEVTWVTPLATYAGQLAFGESPVGAASAPQTLTVTNPGTIDTTFGQATIGGSSATDFAIVSDSCSNQSIGGGAQCAVTLRMTPSAATARQATLTLPSDAPDAPASVALQGTGLTAPGTDPRQDEGTPPSTDDGTPPATAPETPAGPPVAAPPAPKFAVRGKRDAKTGGLLLAVTVPQTGRVTATARSGKKVFGAIAKTTTKAGRLTLALKPARVTRAALRKKRKLPVVITVAFKPRGGGKTQTIRLRATFVRPKR